METNAALLELCPEPLDQDVPDPRHHLVRTSPAPLAPAPSTAHPHRHDHPDAAAVPVPIFIVPLASPTAPSAVSAVSSAPDGSTGLLSPDNCLGLNGHSRATLDAASRNWLLARLPDRVATAMAAATHWELYGTRGLLVVACGEDARRMGFSVESVRRETAAPSTPYEVLTAREAQLAATCPAAERERLITRFWVRKDAAMQAVGRGLSIAPERIEAGFSTDRGTVSVPGPYGLEVPVSVRNFAFADSYEFAVATAEPLPIAPSFAYSVT
ncbi:hypothetical protein OHA45_18965 [Streptomyces lydicus]|uniref:hypothetical protein n=1 Tax=Streptomyces lydicus TaxID=47763 RepID=UPI002E34516C|nr:hypothetical protein [Streptomyces lydicus]